MHPALGPWFITESGLQLVLAVWTRGEQFGDVLARARQDVGDRQLCNDTGKMMVEDGVAVLPIKGPMVRHAEMITDVSSLMSYARVRRDLSAAMADSQVRSIMLRIDSPGGEANGVQELAAQIRAASAIKPVTAYVEGWGTSAAYWFAAAARRIFCAPSALLGSIGTRMALIDSSGAQAAAGVRRIEIVSSQSPGKRGAPVDDEVIARAQQLADDMTEEFINAVAQLRGITPAQVLANYGGGDHMVGRKAVAAGLADELGTFDSVLADLRGRAPSSSGAPAARTGASSMSTQKNEAGEELVLKTDLDAAQARVTQLEQQLATVQPLLDQVAELTSKATVQEQQVALAQLGVRAACAGDLQQQLGDERTLLMAKAKAKKIPPVAMKGWDKLPVEVLRQVVEANEGLQAKKPGGAAQQSEPARRAVQLTDEIRAEYARCGVTDEATMIKREELRLGLAKATGPAAAAPAATPDEDEE